MSKISIALPIHNMKNGGFFLDRCLKSIQEQSFTDFDVIITDNSPEDDFNLSNLIKNNSYGLNIKYFRNKPSHNNGISQNTNEALKHATGELIKIIYMDDYFAHKDALKAIVESFRGNWLVTACLHNVYGVVGYPHEAKIDDNIKFNNTIGSPSVITIRNGLDIFFDENLVWLLDSEFYHRMILRYGKPVILDDLNVIITRGEHQETYELSDTEKKLDYDYLKHKL